MCSHCFLPSNEDWMLEELSSDEWHLANVGSGSLAASLTGFAGSYLLRGFWVAGICVFPICRPPKQNRTCPEITWEEQVIFFSLQSNKTIQKMGAIWLMQGLMLHQQGMSLKPPTLFHLSLREWVSNLAVSHIPCNFSSSSRHYHSFLFWPPVACLQSVFSPFVKILKSLYLG